MIPQQQRERLTRLALGSVRHGLSHGLPAPVELSDWPAQACEHRASFVTLYKHVELRGCIGGLTAVRPLAEDVSQHAYAAAFQDPRFQPVMDEELDALSVHISVLSVPERIVCGSEAELLALIGPGDGLILQEGNRRGTFLPSVWEKLPDPAQFVSQLKRKAGLPPHYWSDTLTVQRYTAESW